MCCVKASNNNSVLYSAVDLHVTRACVDYTGPRRPTGSYLTLSANLQHQAIIPSYRLNCTEMCGSVINWEIYAENNDKRRRRKRGAMESSRTRGSRSTGSESGPLLGLQVWRPVPPAGIINDSTGAGCYSLVGSQGISSIPDNEGRFTLSPTPAYDIPFQHGDVLGFYVNIPDSVEDNINGINILSAPVPNMMVWYTDNQIASTMDTFYLIGNSPPGDLSSSIRVAPAISISIGKQLLFTIQ